MRIFIDIYLFIFGCVFFHTAVDLHVSLQKALSLFVSADRNYHQWSCRCCKKKKSSLVQVIFNLSWVFETLFVIRLLIKLILN